MAADAYLVVMKKPSGSFTELATRNYASIQYDLEQYANAVDAYMSLNDIAVLENNRLVAIKGLMWSFFKNKQFRNAIVQSGKVLDNSAFGKDVHNDAVYISAMSHLNLGEREKALPLLEVLSRESHTAYGAKLTTFCVKMLLIPGNLKKRKPWYIILPIPIRLRNTGSHVPSFFWAIFLPREGNGPRQKPRMKAFKTDTTLQSLMILHN